MALYIFKSDVVVVEEESYAGWKWAAYRDITVCMIRRGSSTQNLSFSYKLYCLSVLIAAPMSELAALHESWKYNILKDIVNLLTSLYCNNCMKV